MASPYATVAGARRFRQRFPDLAPDFFRERFGLQISSIGLGTHPGDRPGPSSQDRVAAVKRAVAAGCNLLDAGLSYGPMQAERQIGQALAELFAGGDVSRDELIICTKGGFVPGPQPAQPNSRAHLQALLDRLDLDPLDVVGGVHCLAPAFLAEQIQVSLRNLGLEAIDIYYLQQPEIQLRYVTRIEFTRRIGQAFAHLEQEAAAGRIRLYGVSAVDGFSQPMTSDTHLDLAQLWRMAQEVGGDKHRFRFIQFPYNLGQTEGLTQPNQPTPTTDGEKTLPLLAAARQLGVAAIGCSGLMQGQLLGNLPPELHAALGVPASDALAALHFNRSTPGLTATLVGMSREAHVEENMQAGRIAALPPDRFFRLFSPGI